MTTVGILLLLTLAGLSLEAIIVRRRTSSLRIRVHVGGTRGKSTVVRYVTAALRQAGYRVLGKVTGEIPTLLLPDGTVRRFPRRGPARVQEQVRLLRMARALSCDAIVVECMSLAPLLQALEARLFRPTLSVLTNILDDHREEYGVLPRAQAESLCAFIPGRATLVSNETTFSDVVDLAARHLSTKVIRTTAQEPDLPSDLPPGVHPENVAVALMACEECGLERAAALKAILDEARNTPGPFHTVTTSRGTVRFLDGFSVNDVQSAGRFLERWRAQAGSAEALAVILNTRADRPLRSLQFAAWCGSIRNLERVVVTGTHRGRTRRALTEHGIDPARITVWSAADARAPVEGLLDLRLPGGCLVVGLGNIAGDGFAIREGIARWS